MNESDHRWISANELAQELESNSPLLLIHTLPEEHFQMAHIPNAINACVYEVAFFDQIAERTTDKTQNIVVYGSRETSWDARTAAEKLSSAGYQNVRILQGGLADWMSAGLPTEGTATGPVTDFGNVAPLHPGTYQVEVAESIIGWTGRNPNGKHFGTIMPAGGEMTLTETAITGRFEIG